MRYIKMFENFGINENLEIDASDDFGLTDSQKKSLENTFLYGSITTDNYELFGRDDEKDLKNAIKWGEIGEEEIKNAVEVGVSKIFPNCEIEVSFYDNGKISVVVKNEDEETLTFDLDNDL